MGSSEDLKARLHRIFDAQIPNYGDYNLVYAAGTGWGRPGRRYILGYRRHPMEIVLAPFRAVPPAPRDAPVAINTTNLSYAGLRSDGGYDVGTSTGRQFHFRVRPAGRVPTGAGMVSLEQAGDQADFAAFMDEFIRSAR